MKSTVYKESVRNSEQTDPSLHHPNPSFRAALLRHATLRRQVQDAIAQLIRGYELTTARSVVRVEYEPKSGRVSIDAIPIS